jgi:hypothetical protein
VHLSACLDIDFTTVLGHTAGTRSAEVWLLACSSSALFTATSSTEKPLLFTDAKMLVEYWERLNEDSGVKVSDEDQEILDVIHPECDMTLPNKEENDEEGNEEQP